MEKEKETEHHGKILIEGNDVKIEVQTHDLNRVTELDQEYAAYCDDVFGDVGFMRELF
jgi:pterin-4a-carbinolamine dehydratase